MGKIFDVIFSLKNYLSLKLNKNKCQVVCQASHNTELTEFEEKLRLARISYNKKYLPDDDQYSYSFPDWLMMTEDEEVIEQKKITPIFEVAAESCLKI